MQCFGRGVDLRVRFCLVYGETIIISTSLMKSGVDIHRNHYNKKNRNPLGLRYLFWRAGEESNP